MPGPNKNPSPPRACGTLVTTRHYPALWLEGHRILSEKQRRFVEAYMATANATEAARRAGYQGDANTLSSVGHENLRKPEIAAAIRERAEADGLVADRQAQQRFWTAVMLDPEQAMAQRLRASELLCKSQGGFSAEAEAPAPPMVITFEGGPGALSDEIRRRMDAARERE